MTTREIQDEARRMLQQIDADIARRPRHFAGWNGTFSGLHDFVDANEYLPPLRSGPYKGEVIVDQSADPAAFERSLARANAIIAETERLLAQRKRSRSRLNESGPGSLDDTERGRRPIVSREWPQRQRARPPARITSHGFAVRDYRSGELLDGTPSEELVTRSQESSNGLVRAEQGEDGIWRHVHTGGTLVTVGSNTW